MRRFGATTGHRLVTVMVLASCFLHANAAADAATTGASAIAPGPSVAAPPAAPPPSPPPPPPAPLPPPPAPAAGPAIVQHPRPFGYVLGDTLAQRVLLQS